MSINGRTHEQREHHQACIEKAILSGRTVAEAVGAASEAFKISEVTAYDDVKAVKRRWASDASAVRKELDIEFGKALARREALYRRAVVKMEELDDRPMDYLRALMVAHRIEIDRCELLGLYSAGGVLVVQRDAPPRATFVITDDELRELAAEKGEAVVLKLTGSPSPPSPHHFLPAPHATSGSGPGSSA